MISEQTLLRRSIAVTCVIAAVGIGFGVIAGSTAILFDGIFSLSDAATTVLALAVARMIAAMQVAGPSALKDRFNMGVWHLEPMVTGFGAITLLGVVVYAFFMAISDLMDGGRDVKFGYAIVYAVVVIACASAMAVYSRRANRTIRSSLVDLDVKGWTMSAALTGALLVAFIVGWLISDTEYAWLMPYIDPTVVALICLVVLPVPIPIIRQALADIFLVTPAELRAEVEEVARKAVQTHGFLSHRAYVMRMGRGRQIELHFIVPPGLPPRPLEDWDAIRNQISDQIGGEGPDRWLTIAFTTDSEWAE